MKLPIPQYRRATQFACGPVCLMMAMKFFQPDLRLTGELEFDIWREANLVESYGTSKEGLALAAARRGFDVYTLGSARTHPFIDAIEPIRVPFLLSWT
ncbi:MAG: peptidase C39 family protein [Candidatus Bathyarchaeia archaeon]